MGDVNGDGLDDIVTLHTADTTKEPYVGLVSILLQRPSHNFDFPIVYDCGCAPEQLRLIRNPDKHGMDILYASFLSPYIGPELTKGGFEVVDVRPDGTFTRTRRNEMDLFWNYFGMVDVNQDGVDDLFFTYQHDNNTTPEVETSFRIWYGKYALEPLSPLTGKPSTWKWEPGRRNSFTLYQGPDSQLLSDPRNFPAVTVDLNGDGMMDVVHGFCPDTCLFRQEPYRQLVGAPLVMPPYAGLEGSGFGDLDGDGLPDLVSSPSTSRNAFVMLQTAPGTFTEVGTLGADWLFIPGPSTVIDLDNNGLNDIILTSEDPIAGWAAWNYVWLQTAPGEFTGQRFIAPYRFGPLLVDDVNDDGCRDLLIPALLDYDSLNLQRGRGCEPAIDLGVRVSAVGPLANVVVDHVRGTRPFVDQVVRIVVAPMVKDDHAVGLRISPPAGCWSVAAEAPRRTFDCLLSRLDPGQRVTLPFQLAVAAGNPTSILFTAFLRDGAGDIDGSNNRAQLQSRFVPGPRH